MPEPKEDYMVPSPSPKKTSPAVRSPNIPKKPSPALANTKMMPAKVTTGTASPESGVDYKVPGPSPKKTSPAVRSPNIPK